VSHHHDPDRIDEEPGAERAAPGERAGRERLDRLSRVEQDRVAETEAAVADRDREDAPRKST
jgi:hypothetical protein